jgi:hypothetical protein
MPPRGLAKQLGGRKPLRQRRMGVIEDRAIQHGEL